MQHLIQFIDKKQKTKKSWREKLGGMNSLKQASFQSRFKVCEIVQISKVQWEKFPGLEGSETGGPVLESAEAVMGDSNENG